MRNERNQWVAWVLLEFERVCGHAGDGAVGGAGRGESCRLAIVRPGGLIPQRQVVVGERCCSALLECRRCDAELRSQHKHHPVPSVPVVFAAVAAGAVHDSLLACVFWGAVAAAAAAGICAAPPSPAEVSHSDLAGGGAPVVSSLVAEPLAIRLTTGRTSGCGWCGLGRLGTLPGQHGSERAGSHGRWPRGNRRGLGGVESGSLVKL